MLSGSKKLAEFKGKISADSTARKRLEFLFDEGEYTELDAFVKNGDDLAGGVYARNFRVAARPEKGFVRRVGR